MKNRHLELEDLEEEKTPERYKASAAVPVALVKPSTSQQEEDFTADASLNSFFLCLAVLFVLLGLTLVIFAVASNSYVSVFSGVPLWVVGVGMAAAGLLSVCWLMTRSQPNSNDEERKIVTALQGHTDWSLGLSN